MDSACGPRVTRRIRSPASPWRGGKGDLVREVAERRAAHGVKLAVYLSPGGPLPVEDESEESGGLLRQRQQQCASVIPTDPASFQSNPAKGRAPAPGFTNYTYVVDDYNRYFLNQLYELLTEYGPIQEVWFDGANPDPERPRDLQLRGVVSLDPQPAARRRHHGQRAGRALGRQRKRRRPHHGMERHPAARLRPRNSTGRTDRAAISAAARSSSPVRISGGIRRK